ncbi:hypothetical protein OG579_17015 [Williamsia herbipolensis]|uniref:Uncharacterized protein n=1 Tax=Williamsia herbipolensis TaxID=1603258 RepID=A0AAU4JZZ1_9NOCA|nr:hypothetical protein [Williamsia herbipolensis]
MSAASSYGELPDGLRETLRAAYGSDEDAALALGLAAGAATAAAMAKLADLVGADPDALINAVINAGGPPMATKYAVATESGAATADEERNA